VLANLLPKTPEKPTSRIRIDQWQAVIAGMQTAPEPSSIPSE